MKKIISTYLIFSLLLLPSLPAMAERIPTEVKIKKENNKYCLLDKNSKELLIPCEYDDMKKLTNEAVKVKKGTRYGILYNNGEVAIPIKYDVVTSHSVKFSSGQKVPQYYGADVKNKIIESRISDGTNRDLFVPDTYHKNYPPNAYITGSWASVGRPNLGNIDYHIFVKGKNNVITILDVGKNTYYPDRKSFAGVSYFSSAIISQKNGKWGVVTPDGITRIKFDYDKIITFDAYINEEIRTNEVIYKEISFPVTDKFIAFKADKIYIFDISGELLYSSQKPVVSFDITSDDLIGQIVERSNIYSVVKFKNYPKNGIIQYTEGNKKGLIIVNSGHNTKLPALYDGFIFPDDDSVMFNLLGISFAPLSNILAYNGQVSKKFCIKNVDRYMNPPTDEKVADLLLSAKIRENVVFDGFGATVLYNSILINAVSGDIALSPNFKNKAFNIYEYANNSNIGVAVDSSGSNTEIISRVDGMNTSSSTKDKTLAILTAPLWLPVYIIAFPFIWWMFREG